MSAIQISHLSKSFTTQPVLNDVSLHIRHGEFVAVLGPSGCGKTTLLRTIAGFEPVNSGTITVGDRLFSSPDIHVAPEKRELGIVFQNYALWPHMSVEENVAYSLKVAGVDRNERRTRTQDALTLVGLGDYATRRPSDLSGGQRQRVALARCLVTRPGVVLLDEPLANLDVHLRAAMEEEFSRFHQHTGATLLYITHDQQEAMAIADRVVVMNEGKVMQFATPQTLYREPANAMVATFIDDGRVIPAQNIRLAESGIALAEVLGLLVRLRASPDQQAVGRAGVCVHAAGLRFAQPGEQGIAAQITRVIYRGGYHQIDVAPHNAPELRLSLHSPAEKSWHIGDNVTFTIADGWIIPQ
ncbi:ABC transporter ATP-binding protein [Rahnella woolbedingensis]|uniref:ABC transporter ATP-binding protein n=1 Tax=Rahnella woolbedingensis TaxID=1510574 RepID=A0A419N4K3_9GAMM|nr:ABC transporter ATP-binding protein [Rahnella woolbedingensis]RJT40144.1 ABC transporter ATP-binding protein [Rahnella woolbedingensis]